MEEPSSPAPSGAPPGALEVMSPTESIKSPLAAAGDDRDGLEERYNKLKTIAVKLKKRINEQNEEIARLEGEKSKSQNASKIQSEFDKAQDEVEKLRKEKRILEKDIQSAVEENVRLKVETTEHIQNLQSLTSSHKVLREKVEKMEKDLAELEPFKEKAINLEEQLKQAKEAGESAEIEKKQSAILSLEITDYEKKLQDSYKQLEEKKAEVEALRTDLDSRSSVVEDLEEKLKTGKEREEQLGRMKDSLQADVTRKLEKIGFLQDEMNKLKDKLSEKNLDYIKLEQEYENGKIVFSSQSKELVEKCDGFQRLIGTLEHKISALEENKRSRETHIANLKLEIQQLDSEYNNYKTKAQTMLKSQKPQTPTEQSDELENLQKIVQNFQSDIAILKTDLQTVKLENDNLQMEKNELLLRLNQAKSDALEKEIRLNNEIQKYKNELRDKEEFVNAKLEEMEKYKAETILLMEAKIQRVREKYEERIQALQDQIDSASGFYDPSAKLSSSATDLPPQDLKSAFRPLVVDGAPCAATNRVNSDIDVDSVFDNTTQPLTIDTGNLSFEQLRLIPRGECEGSESVGSAFTPRVSVDNYLSFEQLLSSSSVDASVKDGYPGGEKEKNGVSLKEELVRSQNQVTHLTSLLRESESNCERLTQLSDALKEEIRRVERDKGRKEHLKENTEYLKNVLLKFMTLNGEEERRRLIPVMQTMLQLSSDEIRRLENCVKGKDGDGNSGWSSYLPIWGGADK